MFTGIVEELGTVAGVEDQGDAMRITIRANYVLNDVSSPPAALGDSIAVNGCCLTVAERDGDTWTADVMQETLDKTSLAGVQPGDKVNLERAVTPTTRLGGHIVQGHVDGVGTIASRTPSEHWEAVDVSMPSELARYLVDKGSVTVDGVSLTVVEARADGFTVSLIPETLARTTLGSRAAGRPRQPRGRHPRQARREAARRSGDGREGRLMTEPQHVGVRMDSVERAVADIAAGKAVIVVDDESRENEGDLIFAASKATPELMAFTIRLQQRRDLRADAGHDARPARDPADDAAQQGPDADGVHDLGRRARRRHDRHLGRRPRPHRAGAGRLGHRAVGDHPSRDTSSRCATATAASWPAAGTPRPRSTWRGSRGSPRPACWSSW